MDCIPAVFSQQAALLVGTDVYLPGPNSLSGGVYLLESAEAAREAVPLNFSRRLPFPAAALTFGQMRSARATIDAPCHNPTAVARRLVSEVIRQWRRSRESGIPYDRADQPKPSGDEELSEDELEEIIGSPRLIWFGWTWSLEPADDGPVLLHGSRLKPVAPVPVSDWWYDLQESYRRRVMSGRAATAPEYSGDDETIRMPDFNTRRTISIYRDHPLEIMWNGEERHLEFAMHFASFALGDADRKVYVFPEGSFAVRGDFELLTVFSARPEAHSLRTRVRMDRSDILHPCVGSSDRSLCTAGGLDRVRESGLSPAGIILSSLELGVQVLLTGVGPNGPTVHRSLSNTRAPSMTEAEARRRGIEFVPWRYSERGMTEVFDL